MKFLIAFISLCITITAMYTSNKTPKAFPFRRRQTSYQYIDVSGYHSEMFSSDEILWELQISLI